MHIIAMLVAAFFTFVIVFAVTFTVVVLYIAKHRRVKSKYHFTGAIEVPETNFDIDTNSQHSPVDQESAKLEWERKHGYQ